MSLKENFTKEAKVAMADYLLDEIEKYGFGSMLKSDQDALLYHLISTYINPAVIQNRHDWIKVLRVKPSRLNSVQETASVKFNKIEDDANNWLMVSKQLKNHAPEIKDKESGEIVVYIDDAHIYRFLEWFLNQQGSSPSYELNKTRLIIKYEMYLLFLEKILNKVGVNSEDLKQKLKEDKSSKKIKKTYNSGKALLEDIKEELKNKTIGESVQKLLEYGSTTLITYFKNKTE